MKKNFLLALVGLTCLCGCNNNEQSLKEKQAAVENGKIDSTYTYEAKEVGWKTSLPKDWSVITKEETDKLNAKGKDVIEKTNGVTIDVSNLKELVNLKKDAVNSFISTMEPFDEAKDGSYADKNKQLASLMTSTYESKGMKIKTDERNETVAGLEFNVIDISIFKPNSKEVLLTQKMYSRLQHGYDFSMTMIYNNPKDSATLQHIINNSKFSLVQ